MAISNHRIKRIDIDNNVTFEYKDYADEGKKKSMTLTGEEFLRRYEQHILPPRFCKIRHYGYLGNYKRKQRVNEMLQQMELPQHAQQLLISSTIRMIEKYGTDGYVMQPVVRRQSSNCFMWLISKAAKRGAKRIE
ncbi:MAG: transposase [Segetibacter sp.]